MVEENISQEYRLKNIEEVKNYFIKEKDQNKLMSNKYKQVFTTLNYRKLSSFCFSWMYFNFCICFFT